MIAVFLALLLQVKVPDPAQFVGAPKGTPLSGAALERRTQEVSSLLRCPVCQGMSVADSPSTVALDMKEQVRELLGRGYTQEQILRYFEQSYGQFVLLKPQFRGVNALVWILPIVVLMIGAFVVFSKARRLTTDHGPPTTAEDKYINRVRELVDRE
jgi:cytochrome c-type biogenesis protein CcmH